METGSADAPDRTPPPRGAASLRLQGTGTILVVDDEETVRGVVEAMLEQTGFRVLTAADGQEAIDLFSRQPADVRGVVLDMTMPGLSGLETFRAIRAIRPQVPILISSGFSEQEVVRRFSAQERFAFIQKPYRMSDMLARLGAVLGD